MDTAVLIFIIALAMLLYITRWIPIEITSILIPPALFFSGVIDVPTSLSGLSSSATVTIASMYVLSAGLKRTGVLEGVTMAMSRYSGNSVRRFLVVLALTIPFTSAFMNNTPVVVMMVPVVMSISNKLKSSPSKLMIPLSYLAIVGGTCTLIGTSTNILVHELYREAGGSGFTMFDFAPLGLVFTVAGALFMLITGGKLLPDRQSLSSFLTTARSAKFVTEVVLENTSPLVGRNVDDIFADEEKIRLIEIVRDGLVTLMPEGKKMTFEPGDSLIIEGTSKRIAEFLTGSGAALSSVVEDNKRVPTREVELRLAEAVIPPESPFIGMNVAELSLNRNYGVKVMAIQRRGRHHRYNIRMMRLRPGDVMLLQAGDHGFAALRDTESVMIVEGVEKTIHLHRRGPLAVAVMAAVILAAAFTNLPIAPLALTGAAMMILLRCVRMDEAMRSLDPSVLLLLVGTIPLGAAMTGTGLAEKVVHGVVELVGQNHPVIMVSALFLLTTLLSQFLSNNATAVLMTPIVLALAAPAAMGVDAKPLLMAVSFGASASFMTPIGYQTNTIVMGPGGYRFSDYLRIGIPMTLLTWLLATFLIPVFWPF